MYKVHNSVIKEHGEIAASYLVVDTETQKIVCAGETDITNEKRTGIHRRQAMRESLSHAILTVEPQSTLQVYDHRIPDASLITGRLRSEITSMIDSKNLSIKFSSTPDSLHDVAHGLMCMSKDFSDDFSEPFSTAISQSDYQLQNPVHLFTDGSYNNQSADGATAIGYALVDDAGTLIGLGSHSIPSAHSSLEAEYEAVRAGVNKARKYDDLYTVTLRTDNRRVYRTLSGVMSPLDRNESLVSDIESTYDDFESIEIKKTSRGDNRLADSLAGYGHESTIVGTI